MLMCVGAHTWVCVWRPEVNLWFCSSGAILASLLFETVSVSHWDLQFTDEAKLTGQVASPRCLSVSATLHPQQ